MHKPKVSIIVPVYNVEKYLDRCMQSLLSQTLKDIEIILVDDESPDNCPAMCDKYAQKDNRVKVIHKKNEGLGFARNSGLEITTGEYVAFVDSDDYVDVRMYENLYSYCRNKAYDVVFCGFKQELANGKNTERSECFQPVEYIDENVKGLVLDFVSSRPYEKEEYKFEMSVWHSIYSTAVIKDRYIRFVSERDYASEDIPFQIDFIKHSTKILFIPDVLYYYCYNDLSLTKKEDFKKFEKFKKIYGLLNEKLEDIDINGFRVKRLFISYIRAYLRLISKTELKKKEKLVFYNKIVEDSIWDEFKEVYLIKYTPLYQGLVLWLIYYKKTVFLYYYLKLYNFFGK